MCRIRHLFECLVCLAIVSTSSNVAFGDGGKLTKLTPKAARVQDPIDAIVPGMSKDEVRGLFPKGYFMWIAGCGMKAQLAAGELPKPAIEVLFSVKTGLWIEFADGYATSIQNYLSKR